MYVLLLLAVISIANGKLFHQLTNEEDNVDSLPYTNSWAIEIQGGIDVANDIARRHGLTNLGQVGSLDNVYHFMLDINENHQIKGMYGSELHTRTLALRSENMIRHVEQQKLHRWHKKYLQPTVATDPLWGHQWSVNNTGQTGEPNLYLDMRAEPAWIQGYTGNDIIVSVVDDGVQHTHRDLKDNYNSQYSYDYNSNVADPSPVGADSHGTACAGQIGMVRTNRVCGVGVAYDAQIAGIRLLGSSTTDVTDARAISHSSNAVHIYSNSWGPRDTGYEVAGPGRVTLMTLRQGVQNGRNGRGNIFTWAAGNGGGEQVRYDSCAADGYSQSIYGISVGAYSQNGRPSYYDEKCSAKQVVAFVDNTRDANLDVVTLTLNNQCTRTFSGTSSATPYVSGVIALALDANPNLTWRDVQYLIAYTSNSDFLISDDKVTNGGGLVVSHQFGFGAIDAEAMVTRAQHWTNVPSQVTHSLTPNTTTGTATHSSPLNIPFTYSGTIRYLEHIVVTVTVTPQGATQNVDSDQASSIVGTDARNGDLHYNRYMSRAKRGDIFINITSPNGTTSTLLFTRPYDIISTTGYIDWPLLSVLHWGENPNGQWNVLVGWNNTIGSVMLSNISVSMYGTASIPISVSRIPTQCHSSCARTRGCASAGAQYCDACNSTLLRNATSKACIQPSQCVSPNEIASGYCYIPSAGWKIIANKFILILVLVIAIKLF